MYSDNAINILVDDREKNDVTIALEAFEWVNVAKQRLTVGDYEIDGQLLIERKTLPDLITSIKDGRLFTQAGKLAESPLRSFIIKRINAFSAKLVAELLIQAWPTT